MLGKKVPGARKMGFGHLLGNTKANLTLMILVILI
jgi:hypothetical protein